MNAASQGRGPERLIGTLRRPRVLLCMLEFCTWERARAWGYVASLAMEEGLAACGVDCVLLPAMHEVPTESGASWLYHARRLLEGERFDQVWIWLVHNSYDPATMEWLRSLAPVTVGWVGESLEHTAEEMARFPHLARRQEVVTEQIRQMTHVLAVDERDAEYVTRQGLARAVWIPMAVPARYLAEGASAASDEAAVFCGSPYGERAQWLEDPLLKGLLRRAAPPESQSALPGMFDRLHQQVFGRSEGLGTLAGELLPDYVSAWRAIRRELFDVWMDGLSKWPAMVNLPSVGKVYTSRVVEAMAVGTPVVSWDIPGRPRNRALFEDGREILLFPKSAPSALAAQLDRLRRDPELRRELAESALRRVRAHHTVEQRAQQILRWIETGEEPDYCGAGEASTAESALARFSAHLEEATARVGVEASEVSRRARMLQYLEQAQKDLLRGDARAAISTWEAAVAAYPEVSGFRQALASLEEKLGRPDRAAAVYARGVADHPQNLSLLMPATDLALRHADASAALEYLSRASGIELRAPELAGLAQRARAAAALLEERGAVLRARQVDENRRYRIADDYVSRAAVEAHDDTSFTDEWQDEVYSRARQLVDQNRLTSIFDIGCGSGFKLMKYFSSLASVGAEISPTYEFLLQKYPERRWIRSDFSVPFAEPVDVVLAADVIEHLADPDALMRFISGINCKLIVLSTTARDLLGDGKGPPRNPCHAREWTADEFRAYVGSHFRVVEHGISNPAQAAQYVVCAPGSSAPRTGLSG